MHLEHRTPVRAPSGSAPEAYVKKPVSLTRSGQSEQKDAAAGVAQVYSEGLATSKAGDIAHARHHIAKTLADA